MRRAAALLALTLVGFGSVQATAQAAPTIYEQGYASTSSINGRLNGLYSCYAKNPYHPNRCRKQGIALIAGSTTAVRRMRQAWDPDRNSCSRRYRVLMVDAFQNSGFAGAFYAHPDLIRRYIDFYNTDLRNANRIEPRC